MLSWDCLVYKNETALLLFVWVFTECSAAPLSCKEELQRYNSDRRSTEGASSLKHLSQRPPLLAFWHLCSGRELWDVETVPGLSSDSKLLGTQCLRGIQMFRGWQRADRSFLGQYSIAFPTLCSGFLLGAGVVCAQGYCRRGIFDPRHVPTADLSGLPRWCPVMQQCWSGWGEPAEGDGEEHSLHKGYVVLCLWVISSSTQALPRHAGVCWFDHHNVLMGENFQEYFFNYYRGKKSNTVFKLKNKTKTTGLEVWFHIIVIFKKTSKSARIATVNSEYVIYFAFWKYSKIHTNNTFHYNC